MRKTLATDHLISFGKFLKNGGRPFVGQQIVLEMSLYEHVDATIMSFEEQFTNYNWLTVCRIADNTATVTTEHGVTITKFPFSMIYVKK